MDAWDLLIKAARKALLELAPEGTPPQTMAEAMKAHLRNGFKEQAEAEWAEAVGANLSEGWLRELMKAQAAEWAMEANALIEA